jgi:hypothetical protein
MHKVNIKHIDIMTLRQIAIFRGTLMRYNLFILIAFASLTAYAFVEKLYFSGAVVLVLAFTGMFIKENVDVPFIREWLNRRF